MPAIVHLLLVWMTLLLVAVIILLGLTVPVSAQLQPITTKKIPVAHIDITAFPVLTVTFDCAVNQLYTDTYQLYQDEQRQVVRTTRHTVQELPTQVAILLDLYRDKEAQLPPAMVSLLAQDGKAGEANDLRDYLIQLSKDELVMAGRDSLGIFVPDRDLVTPHTLLASRPFTYDVNSLINQLNGIFENNPGSARLITSTTTGLVDLSLQLLEQFDYTTPLQRILLIFSDGTDEIFTGTRESLIMAAITHEIPIYTAFIATSTPGDPTFLQTLAEKTGGKPIVMDEADVVAPHTHIALPTLLTDLFQKQRRCQLIYRTNQAQPKEIRIRNVAAELVAVGTLPKLVVPSPRIKLEPLAVSAITTQSVTATVTATVNWAFPGPYPDRQIRSIQYTVKGPVTLKQTHSLTAQVVLSHSTSFTLRNFITGGYLIEAQIVDDLGLSATMARPFGLYRPPTQIEQETATLSWWQQLNAWLEKQQAALGTLLQNPRFVWLQIILWTMTLLVLLIFLFRWLLRKRLTQQQETQAIAAISTDYSAALVRIRSDPKAPPLLPLVPLGHKATMNIPEELYHPIWKHHQRDGVQNIFSEWYRATITTGAATQFTIQREPLHGPDAPPHMERQEPISIQVAETAQSFELVSNPVDSQLSESSIKPRSEFGPLHEGDIIQFGETHYKFMWLKEKSTP